MPGAFLYLNDKIFLYICQEKQVSHENETNLHLSFEDLSKHKFIFYHFMSSSLLIGTGNYHFVIDAEQCE